MLANQPREVVPLEEQNSGISIFRGIAVAVVVFFAIIGVLSTALFVYAVIAFNN